MKVSLMTPPANDEPGELGFLGLAAVNIDVESGDVQETRSEIAVDSERARGPVSFRARRVMASFRLHA